MTARCEVDVIINAIISMKSTWKNNGGLKSRPQAKGKCALMVAVRPFRTRAQNRYIVAKASNMACLSIYIIHSQHCQELPSDYSSIACTWFFCHRCFHYTHCNSSGPHSWTLFKNLLTLRTRKMDPILLRTDFCCSGAINLSLWMVQRAFEIAPELHVRFLSNAWMPHSLALIMSMVCPYSKILGGEGDATIY